MGTVQQIRGDGAARAVGTLASGRFPLARLLQLIGLLQTGRFRNARRLAEICEVSPRTIYRDLALLSDAGLSVLYRPDRQGYELERNVFHHLPRLEEREALALLGMSRGWGDGEDLGLSLPAQQAVDKVIQGLPEEYRAVDGCRKRPGDAPRPVRPDPDRQSTLDTILTALVQRRQVRLGVLETPGQEPSSTKFAIYRMTPIKGEWCLIGRSTLHCRVLLLPLSRIEHAELTDDAYTIPPRFHLGRFLGSSRPDSGRAHEVTAVLRFDRSARSQALSASWPYQPQSRECDGGGIELSWEAVQPLELVPLLLGFGTEIEVVVPASLRTAVAEQASRIARHHASPTRCSSPLRASVGVAHEPQDRWVVDSGSPSIRMINRQTQARAHSSVG